MKRLSAATMVNERRCEFPRLTGSELPQQPELYFRVLLAILLLPSCVSRVSHIAACQAGAQFPSQPRIDFDCRDSLHVG
jgi:hypothetical protein